MLRLYPLFVGAGLMLAVASETMALPPPDDIPEEVLRTEIITQARSPLDGKPISAPDYAALQEGLRDPNVETVVNPDLAELVELLRLRRILRPILPFLR